ncbi:hypothetical protein Lesp02_32050 [Lentzea sp. NBRC 105346]|uniref:DivIVA domain-containing protein n=1 Tax=Lentzea sp. NBRC 105346 TaxID=3032205 RepID=UPI0024A45DE6|nr:DivIVA domain-containing protein [Lentzea sp. NBRC 105346]GLZ31016.1 hypothetical protein Lesp02_32050 [Lentzea sp. NBRC 105346]
MTTEELLPLRTGFDTAWPGYRRDQVRFYVRNVENELRTLIADRDAALTRADALAAQLEAARRENSSLRGPLDLDRATAHARQMIEQAQAEAEEITERALALAERGWTATREAQERLRRRYDWLVNGIEALRREAQSEHTTLMRNAHQQVASMTEDAVRRRHELDHEAAELRRQIMSDFDTAMVARRAEQKSALDRLVGEAAERVRVLCAHRDRVAAGLLAVRDFLDGAEV